MFSLINCLFLSVLLTRCAAEVMYTNGFNFRVDAGGRTCFFEEGKAGQTMEVYYEVLDGQHGDLDISLDIVDPTGNKIVSDYKKSQNAIIKDLALDGDYSFCLDNTFSIINSKLVFVYVMIEDQDSETAPETEVAVENNGSKEVEHVETLQWTGIYDNGELYYIDVKDIADSLSRTLKHVIKARHMLDLYAAGKSRESYMAFEDTFVVDMWSGFQIICMCVVGLTQVYLIKKLFISPKKY